MPLSTVVLNEKCVFRWSFFPSPGRGLTKALAKDEKALRSNPSADWLHWHCNHLFCCHRPGDTVRRKLVTVPVEYTRHNVRQTRQRPRARRSAYVYHRFVPKYLTKLKENKSLEPIFDRRGTAGNIIPKSVAATPSWPHTQSVIMFALPNQTNFPRSRNIPVPMVAPSNARGPRTEANS